MEDYIPRQENSVNIDLDSAIIPLTDSQDRQEPRLTGDSDLGSPPITPEHSMEGHNIVEPTFAMNSLIAELGRMHHVKKLKEAVIDKGVMVAGAQALTLDAERQKALNTLTNREGEIIPSTVPRPITRGQLRRDRKADKINSRMLKDSLGSYSRALSIANTARSNPIFMQGMPADAKNHGILTTAELARWRAIDTQGYGRGRRSELDGTISSTRATRKIDKHEKKVTAKIDKRYHKLQALANGGENRTATPETANNNRGGKLAKRVNRRIDRHARLARQYTERISELEERRLESSPFAPPSIDTAPRATWPPPALETSPFAPPSIDTAPRATWPPPALESSPIAPMEPAPQAKRRRIGRIFRRNRGPELPSTYDPADDERFIAEDSRDRESDDSAPSADTPRSEPSIDTAPSTTEASQKQPSKAVKAAKSAIKFTARTITNVDRAASKKLNYYVENAAINQAERRATRLRGQAEALNWQINSHEQNRDSAGAVSKKTTRQLAKTISRKSSLADWKLANARQEEARAARIRHKSQE